MAREKECLMAAVVISSWSPVQDQDSQPASMEWEVVHEAPPLTGEL